MDTPICARQIPPFIGFVLYFSRVVGAFVGKMDEQSQMERGRRTLFRRPRPTPPPHSPREALPPRRPILASLLRGPPRHQPPPCRPPHLAPRPLRPHLLRTLPTRRPLAPRVPLHRTRHPRTPPSRRGRSHQPHPRERPENSPSHLPNPPQTPPRPAPHSLSRNPARKST